MHKILTIAALIAFAATTAFAAETITLPAKNGDVTFPHAKHQGSGCSTCHAGKPGKIAEMGKDWAHKTCKGCHADKGAGPTNCGGCHKK